MGTGRGRKRKNTKLLFPFPIPPSAVRRSSDSAEAGEARSLSQDSGSKEVDTQPSWRPPMPVEEGIWKPIRLETNSIGKKPLRGDILVEVYGVEVHLHEKISGHIHGDVTLQCQCFIPVLFNRDKEHALTIRDMDSLPLDGPDVAPLGIESVYISVDLKIDDDELCEGYFLWSPRVHLTNRWLVNEIQGKKGSVLVTYGVMSSACLSELDVKLSESIETPLRIHGDIVVYINNMQYLSSSLVVKMDLWNSDTNDPLAQGALLFPLEYYGEIVGTLGGQNVNMIQVKVNWLYHMDHPKTKATVYP